MPSVGDASEEISVGDASEEIQLNSTAAPLNQEADTDADGSFSTGTVVGIAVGCVVALLLVCATIGLGFHMLMGGGRHAQPTITKSTSASVHGVEVHVHYESSQEQDGTAAASG